MYTDNEVIQRTRIGTDSPYSDGTYHHQYHGTQFADDVEARVAEAGQAVANWWERRSADQVGIYDDAFRLATGGAKNVANYWKGARTVDNPWNPLELAEAAAARTIEGGLKVLDAGSYYGGIAGGNIARMIGVDPRIGGAIGNIGGDLLAGGIAKRAVTIGKTAKTLKYLQKTDPLAAMQAGDIIRAGKGKGYAFAYAGEGFEGFAQPGLVDAVTASGKTHKKVAKVRKLSQLDDLARRWQQADNLTPSEFAELKKDLGKLNLRDKNSVISSPRGGDIKEATTVDFTARNVGQRASHHRAGLDVTGTPLERLGPRGNKIRDQINLDAITGETKYNYMSVADTFTSGTRRQRLENVLDLTFEHVDETKFSKPVLRRDLKRSYNDAYGVSDLDFGEVKKGVIPPPTKGSYPKVRGPNGEDILRIQNNINPNSPITTRIWNDRFKHIADYYGIDRKHLKGRKGFKVDPRTDRIAGDHGYIHEAIRLAQDDPNTALGKLQQLGAFDRKMDVVRSWDNISNTDAIRLLTQSVREQNQIALYVAADKIKRIKEHRVLGKLWKDLSIEQIPEFMEQYSMDIAGLGWYDMAKGVNKKKLRKMLSMKHNVKSADYKRLQKAFMLEDLPTAYNFSQLIKNRKALQRK